MQTLLKSIMHGAAALALTGWATQAACAAEEDAWVSEARGIAKTLPPKLVSVLNEEIAKGGPENAINVCREKAPQMAKIASEQTGWQVRRVSLRHRNPKAVPDAWEQAALLDFDRRAAAGEDPAKLERSELVNDNGRLVYRYVRALPTQPMCLSCHGPAEQLSPSVLGQFKTLYPDDHATGYASGQLRGAITLRKPAQP